MSAILKSDFGKSLAQLEKMSKGQLFHTSSDSSPGNWAGANPEDVDSMGDNIDANGTDYNGVKKSLANKVSKGQKLTPAETAIVKGQNPLKLVADKISKGESLTPAEAWVVSKGMETFGVKKSEAPGEAKDANSVPETHAADDDEVEAEVAKSLDTEVSKSAELSKGIEMSPFLYEFTRAMGEALKGTEVRVQTTVAKSLASAVAPILQRLETVEKSYGAYVADQGAFNQALAEAVSGIGHQISGTAQLAAAAASTPVGAPKSQLRSVQGGQGVNVVNKSFGPGGLDMSDEALNKSQIVNIMTELVQKGNLNALEVIKYESTGEMRPEIQQRVMAAIQGVAR